MDERKFLLCRRTNERGERADEPGIERAPLCVEGAREVTMPVCGGVVQILDAVRIHVEARRPGLERAEHKSHQAEADGEAPDYDIRRRPGSRRRTRESAGRNHGPDAQTIASCTCGSECAA